MIRKTIQKMISEISGLATEDFQVEKPKGDYGDYAVNAAFILAKREGKSPAAIATELVNKLNSEKDNNFEKIEAVGGYVNFFLSKEYLLKAFSEITTEKGFGRSQKMKGQTIMIEYTDANPFKLFHIGHLMSNFIGETTARLHEALGAKVIRTNYQGDVGLHVAMTIWSMGKTELPAENSNLKEKVEFLGKCYAKGSKIYRNKSESNPEKTKIEEINDKIYSKTDKEINHLYDLGKKWSLEYFEEIYKKLGTKFDESFFESQAAEEGLELVKKNENIFTESDGATIFKGEEFGLHTRVFINSKGLPTYETKELGLNKKKFELYPLDLSIIVTGNEIVDYFRVLLKVMELTIPDVAHKTKHLPHGMLRLPTGKMSSRTGDVITADTLIEQIKTVLKEKETNKLSDDSRDVVAIGAIRYSILKQSPGRDVVFDFDKSLSVEGDSGPYLQYTYARLNSILEKAPSSWKKKIANHNKLEEKTELNLIRHLLDFQETIEESCQKIAPQHLALYLYQLANLVNSFYEKVRILTDEDEERLTTRLILVETVAKTIRIGLDLLGIKTLAKI